MATATEAYASWTSQTSICSGLRPARSSALGIASRRDAHDLRIERMGRRGHDARQRLRAQLVRRLGAREHNRAGAVVERRGVARRHLGRVRLGARAASFSAVGVVADALVVLERARRLLAPRRDLNRMDLVGEPARVARRSGVLVRAEREGVDLLARQLVFVGDVLGRLASSRCRRCARAVSGSAARPHRPTSCPA